MGFPGISLRTHWWDGLQFCMLIYFAYLQKWVIYGYGLLIFLILALFWHSETGLIWRFRAFPGERTKGIAWNFACCCILTTFRTDLIMVTVCWFCLILVPFDLVNRVKFGVSGHFGRAMWILLIMMALWLKIVIFGFSGHYEANVWELIFPMLCVELCLVVVESFQRFQYADTNGVR